MRFPLAILTLAVFAALSSDVFAADAPSSSLPKNLLRYNVGALPMTQSANGTFVTTRPDSIDWSAPYSAVLAGDLGKTVNLAATKTFLVDLGQIEATNRFSLFSQNATGSLTVFSSPVFEDPTTGKWSNLGTLSFAPGKPASVTWSNTDARYIRLVFSPESTGTLASLGLFGTLTYADVKASDALQGGVNAQNLSLNYATPATAINILSSTPALPTQELMALFDDDPATQLRLNEPLTLVIDLGGDRRIENLSLLSDAPVLGAQIKFSNSAQAFPPANPTSLANGLATLQNPGNAHYAQITFTPSNSAASLSDLAFVGPVNPTAFVFDRPPAEATPAAEETTPSGPLPPVPPIDPPFVSSGGI